MYRSILVPTDFSDCSAVAYSYASMLAEKTGATIHLLHILDIPTPSPSASGHKGTLKDTHFMMEMMKLTKARMNKVRNLKPFLNADVREMIEIGSVPDMILKAVKKLNVNMIVMGTHGTSGMQEKFIGTNAERIVRSVNVPVLSVKHAVKNPKLDTIVFATDFSQEAEDVLPAVSSVAELLKARLILTKIVTMGKFETTEQTERQIELFRANNKIFEYSTSVYYADSKEEGVRKYADSAGADMIALGTHGRHGLSHLFYGSVAEDVVTHASLPVLTLNFRKTTAGYSAKSEKKNTRKYESDFLYQIPSV